MESSTVACIVFVIVIGIIVITLAISFEKGKERALKAYHASIEALRADPTHASLRTNALKLGREYSNLIRDSRGITTFDEVAIKNDIDAACAGATYVIRQEDAARERIGRELLRPVGNLPQTYDDPLAPVVAAAPSIEDRFSILTQLRQQDLISENEYQAKRLKLLDEV